MRKPRNLQEFEPTSPSGATLRGAGIHRRAGVGDAHRRNPHPPRPPSTPASNR